jgi:hypothetical protein
MDPEELIEDTLVMQSGYYPHQMAQKITETLTAAGYEITRKPTEDVRLCSYCDGTGIVP